MKLTMYEIETMIRDCDFFSKKLKEIKKSLEPENEERKKFVSLSSYNSASKLKYEVPQDFYYFRYFDVLIQLVFNKREKIYTLWCENFYSDILKSYARDTRSEYTYKLYSDFESSHDVYLEIIKDFINRHKFVGSLY